VVHCDAGCFADAAVVCESVAEILRIVETLTGLFATAASGYEAEAAAIWGDTPGCECVRCPLTRLK